MPEERAGLRLRWHQHLRRNRDFQVIRRNGRRINCGVFLCQILNRTGDAAEIPGPRLGVITSRRVGRAVTRNRLRRQMREIFRRHQGKLASAVDLILIMRASAVGLSSAELEARFLKAVERNREESGRPPRMDSGKESKLSSRLGMQIVEQ